MKIILVRHVLTEENKKDILLSNSGGHLSKEGINQVKKLAEWLKNEKIDMIYSSDLKRTQDTIESILKYHPKTPVVYDSLLREMHKGIYDGRSSKELKKEFRSSGQEWFEFRPKGGENYKDLLERVRKFYHRMMRENKSSDTVLICSHDSWLGTFMILFTGRQIENVDKNEYGFHNASITELEINNKEQVIKNFNQTSHLN